MPTVLLVCIENTFWHTSRDSNFVELFKESFKLCVESGMMKKLATDINILKNEPGHPSPVHLATEDFKAKIFMFITEHYLCKIPNHHDSNFFYFRSTHLTFLHQPMIKL